MDEILQHEIQYTPSAKQDLLDKANYIAYTLQFPETALTWSRELRENIQHNLDTFPYRVFLSIQRTCIRMLWLHWITPKEQRQGNHGTHHISRSLCHKNTLIRK